jgi:putative ABC transport system permease protein
MRLDFANSSRNDVFLRVVGRLKQGVTLERAQVQVDGIASDLRQRFPIKQTSGLYFRVEPMHKDLVKDARPAILALMGAVMFLLLIACANVANLVLVRASWRERELAVRAALGAGRWSLIRQMLAESLLIAFGGAVLGLLLARLGIDLLVLIGPADLPRLDSVTINPTVLAFTALASLAAAAMFGVVPALRASRPDVVEALRSSGRTAGLAAGRLLRSGVVIAEVALSFVLLIGSGLMLRSMIALQHVDPGFDSHGVLTFFLAGLRGQGPQRAVIIQQLRERLRALPGVQAVTAASPLPLDGGIAYGRWGTEEAVANPGKFHEADFHFVLPGYFEALRTNLIEGRTFTDADNVPGPRLLVIDSDLAAIAFPNQSAVGKRLLVRARTPEPEWFEVIGVVAHQRHTSLARPGHEALFLTDAYMGQGAVARWAVRGSGDPAQLGAAVRQEVARLDPRLVVSELQPMQTFVDQAQAQTRFALLLIAMFATIAAVLAAIGLYGVLSAAVRQRTAEIGVRMALGAAPAGIFRLMVGQGIRLSALGIALGLVVALGLTRVMVSMLVGVQPTDPLTFAAMALFFFVIAAVSSWLPARRAALLDPTKALREE